MQHSMIVTALVSSIINFVHYSTASQVTKQSTLEKIPVSSVPPTELVSCVVPAWITLAWQLDLVGVLNVISHNMALLLAFAAAGVLLVFFILALISESLLLKDSLMESSFMSTLYGPTK